MMKESNVFQFRCRAQLVCSNAKADTYFAIDKQTGQNVVVKGPFLDEGKFETQSKLYHLKKLGIFQDICAIDMQVVHLVPDFLDSKLGMRTKVQPSQAYPFLVFEDKCNLAIMPRVKKSSKLWPEIDVFDASQCNTCLFGIPSRIHQFEGAMSSFMLNSIFKWCFEVTDTSLRNLLFVDDENKVYSIDEENSFTGRRAYLWPSIKYDPDLLLVLKWIKSGKYQLIRTIEEWKEQVSKESDVIIELFGYTKYDTLKGNIDFVLQEGNVLGLIEGSSRKRKRN